MAAPVLVLPLELPAVSGGDVVGREPAPAGPGGVFSPSGFDGAHKSSAVFSPGSRDYRYLLTRWWAPGPVMTWIMLNPSRADEVSDDATVGRCVGFARAADCSAIAVTNLCAWRARDPRELRQTTDPVGPDNDAWISATVHAAAGGPVVAAWGARAEPARVQAVLELLAGCPIQCPVQCLGTTADGQPRHPLYVPARTALQPLISAFSSAAALAPPHEWGPWTVVSAWDGDEEIVERCCLVCGADELAATDHLSVDHLSVKATSHQGDAPGGGVSDRSKIEWIRDDVGTASCWSWPTTPARSCPTTSSRRRMGQTSGCGGCAAYSRCSEASELRTGPSSEVSTRCCGMPQRRWRPNTTALQGELDRFAPLCLQALEALQAPRRGGMTGVDASRPATPIPPCSSPRSLRCRSAPSKGR